MAYQHVSVDEIQREINLAVDDYNRHKKRQLRKHPSRVRHHHKYIALMRVK